jgi:hypothetical protein
MRHVCRDVIAQPFVPRDKMCQLQTDAEAYAGRAGVSRVALDVFQQVAADAAVPKYGQH